MVNTSLQGGHRIRELRVSTYSVTKLKCLCGGVTTMSSKQALREDLLGVRLEDPQTLEDRQEWVGSGALHQRHFLSRLFLLP